MGEGMERRSFQVLKLLITIKHMATFHQQELLSKLWYILTPRSGRPPGGGFGNPLQYSCLENPLDRGAWRATVHRATKSWTRLK